MGTFILLRGHTFASLFCFDAFAWNLRRRVSKHLSKHCFNVFVPLCLGVVLTLTCPKLRTILFLKWHGLLDTLNLPHADKRMQVDPSPTSGKKRHEGV